MPVSELVELARRRNHLGGAGAHQPASAGAAEAAEREEELDVLRELERLVVSAHRLEIRAPAKDDADVHLRGPDSRQKHRVGRVIGWTAPGRADLVHALRPLTKAFLNELGAGTFDQSLRYAFQSDGAPFILAGFRRLI